MGKNHPNVDDYVISRVRALESLLLEKGLLAPDAVDRVIRRYEASTGPMIGARAVARAWRDAAYQRRLLQEPTAALADLGVELRPARRGGEHAGRPQPRRLHALLLLSLGRMGLPPTWYKSPAYRSRAVSEPREVLAEFGLVVPPEREIRVWDSSPSCATWCCRCRPPGAERPGRGRARAAHHARGADRRRRGAPARRRR